MLKNFPDMFKALISIPGTEVEKRRGKGIGKRKGKKKGGAAFRVTDILSTQNMDPHTPYIALVSSGNSNCPLVSAHITEKNH